MINMYGADQLVSPELGLDDLVAHPLLRCNGQLGPGKEWILNEMVSHIYVGNMMQVQLRP